MTKGEILWKVVKTASANIPWRSIVENSPVLLEMVERARGRIRGAAMHGGDVNEQLRVIQEENMRLANALLETSQQMQVLANSLEVVMARQKMLAVVAFVSLLAAVSSLVLWAVK